MEISYIKRDEVPIFEFKDFTIYELDKDSLKIKMSGVSASKYDDRYEIKKIDYTDSTKENHKINIKAQEATFQDDIVYLDGGIVYSDFSKNKFTFYTKKATYDINNSVVVSDTNYTMFLDNGLIKGKSITYDTISNKIISKKIDAKYDIR